MFDFFKIVMKLFSYFKCNLNLKDTILVFSFNKITKSLKDLVNLYYQKFYNQNLVI